MVNKFRFVALTVHIFAKQQSADKLSVGAGVFIMPESRVCSDADLFGWYLAFLLPVVGRLWPGFIAWRVGIGMAIVVRLYYPRN